MFLRWTAVTHFLLLFRFLNAFVDKNVEADVRARSTGNNTVTGFKINPGEYPFSVIFYEREVRKLMTDNYLSPICSGAIINSRWVLITARPLGEYSMNSYFMLAGVFEVEFNSDEVMNIVRNRYEVSTVVIHPDWHEYEANNLGLARSSKPFSFGMELGTVKIPSTFTNSHKTESMCWMGIWASSATELLLAHYQSTSISKQKMQFKVVNSKQCSNLKLSQKSLCLAQELPSNRKDVCAVNAGAIVECDCQAVGLFTGVNGITDCVDLPPLYYTAVNLTYYSDWIKLISEAPLSTKPVVQVSSSTLVFPNMRIALVVLYLAGYFS